MGFLRVVSLFVLCLASSSDAEFSRSMRCPCAASLATENWEPTIEEAVRLSDVVLLGRVVELHGGLRGTMNASLVSIYAYKGRAIFLSLLANCTNFAEGSDLNVMSLFFFAEEPGGNLALRCMSPLQELHSATQGHLRALLNFVREKGLQGNKDNIQFVPPTPDPCGGSPPSCSPEGSFCSVTNTLPGHNYKCTCLTGYRGDGYNCQLPVTIPTDETPNSTPPPVVCGGVSSPLLDLHGNADKCNERDILGSRCPPLHYCHHGYCCPVTPPTTVTPYIYPSPSSVLLATPTATPTISTSPSPTPHPHTIFDCGSGDGSGDCDNTVGSGLQSGSGFDENGRGLDGSGRGLQSGSGFDESGSGQREGSGSPPSPELEGVVAVVWKNNGGGSGGWLEGTAGQSDRLDTLLDDEDMAYGQALRRRRKNYRRDLKT